MSESDNRYNFIELERTFHELSRSVQESDDAYLYDAFRPGRTLSWSDLISEYRVVLLSEAGSGKTEEIRNLAHNLCGEEKFAFFIRLEHIPNDFEDSFEVGCFEYFQEWLSSAEEGWLLLDSVDEARLRSPGDFELAIRKLGRQISTAIDRAHIVITGRTHAWRPKTDIDLCRRHLPFPPPTTAVAAGQHMAQSDPIAGVHTVQQDRREDSVFRIVALDNLSTDQIEVFARARGIMDTTAFLDAVERADAWSFTTRPQDLEELTEFWIAERWIGSKLELMQNSIARRLTERDQNRADTRPLSKEDARQGARIVAAAATLGLEPTIRVPDGADNSKGIPVRDVLPDWDDSKQVALLSRPIFDEAIYGTVRFHHRSVREYLTAEWLAELLERETSRRRIESLFFRNQYGLDVIVPTLRPVMPWLAILDGKVRERLRKIAPEVLFEGGDPSHLPLETRRTILHEVCEQMASGTTGRSIASFEAVQSFANADLVHDVRSLLERHAGNDELTEFLLRMIWFGELSAALPEAKAAALSVSLLPYTRIAAFRAVKAIGSEEDCEEVRQTSLKESAELNREWLAELVKDTIPSPKTTTWLLAALTKGAEKERFSVDRLTDAVEAFAQAADTALLPRILSGLNELLGQPPVIDRRHCEVSVKFGWLLKAAAQCVHRLIRKQHPAALQPAALSVLRKFKTYQDHELEDFQNEKFDFESLVPEWSELNRTLFWYDVEEVRNGLDTKRGERLDESRLVSIFGTYWRFGEDDFAYIANQITSQPSGDNQLVALSLAFELYVDNGRPRRWRERLKALVNSDRKLSERLARYLKPPHRGQQHRKWKQQEAEWNRRKEERKSKEQEHHTEWKKYLLDHIDEIRDPNLPESHDISRAQYYLHERMRERSESLNRWTDGNWRCLIDDYGEDVARAFRDGAVAYWRRYTPTLRSEGAPHNQTPFSVIFGLTGLSIESKETADWLCSLSEDEVSLACRYALHELNGFPIWFPQLFVKHTKPVGGFLLNEIKYELSIEKRDTDTHYVLEDVSNSGEWAWNKIAPQLMELLSAREPKNLTNLRKLLTIIQGSLVTDDEIRLLAVRRCNALRQHTHLALWYAVWTGVDPAAAIPSFARCIGKISRPKDRTKIAMNYVTHLCGGAGYDFARVRTAFHTPPHLSSLYLLMHEYIHPKDDIDRIGKGVYSPGLRDHAQEARSHLFNLLYEISGKEAFLALEEIARTHPDEPARPKFTLHAKRKAAQDADIEPWVPSQIREFHDKLERTPSNHRELAELAIMRLLDLKDDLENGDSSIAQLLQNVTLESEMRKFIGRELREKAYGRYSIPQEEELADAKRPDLRFLGNGFDGPIPVELKLADKWTGPALFERLKNQLCGDYLRDNRSNHGIFVLVYRGEKKAWVVPESANRVDFLELVIALQEHWKKISREFPGIDNISVIGIDLVKRAGVKTPITPE